MTRDENAVKAVFEGLVICGAAMKLAGVSRPASGVEHYLSHIWDMRGAEFGIPVEFHGIQCAVGTLIAVKLYEKVKSVVPNRQKALDYVQAFDLEGWNASLRAFLGKGAETMIALEEKERKYSVEKHRVRLDTILEKWDKIIEIINEELPCLEALETLFEKIGLPKTCDEIGVDEKLLPATFKSSKDIRDKYVLSRLCWDLGIIDEIIK